MCCIRNCQQAISIVSQSLKGAQDIHFNILHRYSSVTYQFNITHRQLRFPEEVDTINYLLHFARILRIIMNPVWRKENE